eukprot:gnl/MRDRNA2_/MRDRNA2_49545_c0_seq1.p1 gnl/MRDRNA2_/MRDRNA2_49545_c0~~gnl/MRDRNA2_/MRDRNA2_49545_c0_seq1.p1  ORF type:complete len:222 (-),score=38.54 gnl/MRDRNA2_/MRDRNA2_49545_c0_seq1:10-675(-)
MQIFTTTVVLSIVASAEQGFLAADKCNQVQLCDAFCKESALSHAGGTSKKLAALALSVRECGQSCGCPFGQERIPPTPYPAPPLPPVPAGMFGPYGNGHPGDPRNGGAILLPPENCGHCPVPPPPLPPLPPVPLADFSTVGDRFLPRLVMPKGEVNEFQDIDYEGNPVPTDPHYNLPPGWATKMYDGKPYYFNVATKQESWIHPASPLFKGALMQTQEHPH